MAVAHVVDAAGVPITGAVAPHRVAAVGARVASGEALVQLWLSAHAITARARQMHAIASITVMIETT